MYRDGHYDYEDGTLSIKQPPVSQAAREKAMKSKAARGVLEGENDKLPCTSKFHFSKGKYGNVVLAWHGVFVHKAKANLPNICAQARKIFGVKDDVEVGNGGVDPEVRIRVGLDSESESGGDDGDVEDHGDDEDHGNDGDHIDRNSWE
jgi:hypothetical protein